jgi:hypothetical protein
MPRPSTPPAKLGQRPSRNIPTHRRVLRMTRGAPVARECVRRKPCPRQVRSCDIAPLMPKWRTGAGDPPATGNVRSGGSPARTRLLAWKEFAATASRSHVYA